MSVLMWIASAIGDQKPVFGTMYSTIRLHA
jgi:hypothetical protein